MKAMERAFEALMTGVAARHGLRLTVDGMGRLPPVALDSRIAALVETEAKRLGLAFSRMSSGAGHDAQTMQSMCPCGLIFVPSRAGISHAPEEWTDWAAIEKGAGLYLAVLCRLTESGSFAITSA
jgi:N-carbamoyl-L-amino-acid hydrolase